MRARIDSPVFRGGILIRRRRHRAAGSARARAAPRRDGDGRAGARAHAGDPVRHRHRRRSPRRPAGTVRAGAAVLAMNAWASALEALPPRDHRARQLHRAHGAGARAARRSSAGPTASACPTTARPCTTCARRPTAASPSAIGGMQPDLARRDRTPLRLRRGCPACRDRRPAPHVPDLRRRADRGRLGRAHRRVGRAPAVLRHPRPRLRALRARLHGQRGGTGAPGRAHPRAPCARPVRRRARPADRRRGADAVPARADPLARRVDREHRDPRTRTSSTTAASSPTRSSTSSRSCPGGSGYNLGP